MWANFVHDTDELVMVVEGEVKFEIEGETYRLPPGEEVLVSVGSKHTARNSGKTESRWLYGYKR